MNDVELMNIQMDHIQRHHCNDPEGTCHVVKVLLEAQAEHQAIVFNQMEGSIVSTKCEHCIESIHPGQTVYCNEHEPKLIRCDYANECALDHYHEEEET